jgi:hypothetical protein
MKKSVFLMGISCLMLVFGLIFTGCEQPTKEQAKTYTVSYDVGNGNGTLPVAKTVEEGTTIILPGSEGLTAPTGQKFDGWRAGEITYISGYEYVVMNDVIFIAQWKANAVAQYTVTYSVNNGRGNNFGIE